MKNRFKKYFKLIFGFLGLILIFLVLGKYIQYSENIKIQKEKLEKNEKQSSAVESLYSSKLFGIHLRQRADILLFKLKNLASSYGNRNEVYEDTGLLKNTKKNNAWLRFYYSIDISEFDSDALIKNEDFSRYFIGYHPRDYEIYTVVGRLKKLHQSKQECVQDLKPYANILKNKISKQNQNERITISDKFYPTEREPSISFSYQSQFDDKNFIVIIIKGYCKNRSSFIELTAPLVKPNFIDIEVIEEKIRENKKLMKKNNFDTSVEQQEKSIDTKGLN